MKEISIQIPEFVDRDTNVRRTCSTVLRGNKKFPSSFLPYSRRYRDDNFVDRVTNVWKKFMFKFQNSLVERQTFVESVPSVCVQTFFFLAVFGHIFIVIGKTFLLIER